MTPESQPTENAEGAAAPPEPEGGQPQAAPQPEPPGTALKLWREWGKPFLIILLVVSSFRSVVADWNDVPTGSMVPTILEGDRIFVNKIAYSLRVPFTQWHISTWDEGPQRGEIIVFSSPDDDKRLVKRVVGVPGDRVELRHNRLIVNNEYAIYKPLEVEDEELLSRQRRERISFSEERLGRLDHWVTHQPWRGESSRNFGPVVVEDGQYFVMGDNRHNSRDSRFFGTVDRKLIYGRATAVAFSFEGSWLQLSPRWNRFFEKLH